LLAKDECHCNAAAILKLGHAVSDSAVRGDMVLNSPEHVSGAAKFPAHRSASFTGLPVTAPLCSRAGFLGAGRPDRQVPTSPVTTNNADVISQKRQNASFLSRISDPVYTARVLTPIRVEIMHHSCCKLCHVTNFLDNESRFRFVCLLQQRLYFARSSVSSVTVA